MRIVALIRNTWRTLTSMGTALVLLFLLALAAIPGALLPQRNLNESKVAEYLAEHPTLGPWLDRLQAFDVFSSFWFTAIYVLLFISLVGCLTPRMVEHVRSLRATPVPRVGCSAGDWGTLGPGGVRCGGRFGRGGCGV
ncbi:cytochrome c biogenesis protein ResB, partial [Mycobacterium sp. NAZ190054]|uniref:cytochrome c biogenesis protein ResB n=1 Tax=Mycobacterium sp. NAZ190054 TaxID=1747766 RepID=UPI000ADFC2BC